MRPELSVIPASLRLSSQYFIQAAAAVAVLDVFYLWALTRMVSPARFQALKWFLPGAAALGWGGFSFFLVAYYWEPYYRYFYPGWTRSGWLALLAALVFALLALAFHSLALRLPGNPILTFNLLAGLESILEHLWGLAVFHIREIPLLQNVSPASMLVFAFPEYIFYWCLVISLALAASAAWQRVRKRSPTSQPNS